MRQLEEISLNSLSATTDPSEMEVEKRKQADKFLKMLKVYNHEYLAEDFVTFYDTITAATYELTAQVDKLKETKYSRDEETTRIRNELLEPIKKFQETGNLLNQLRRARCYKEHTAKCYWGEPLQEVIAPEFRSAIMAIYYSNIRGQVAINEASENMDWVSPFAWFLFDSIDRIERWTDALFTYIGASMARGAKGEVDPYLDEKTKEALEEARKAAARYAEEQRAKTLKWGIGIGLGVIALAAGFTIWKRRSSSMGDIGAYVDLDSEKRKLERELVWVSDAMQRERNPAKKKKLRQRETKLLNRWRKLNPGEPPVWWLRRKRPMPQRQPRFI